MHYVYQTFWVLCLGASMACPGTEELIVDHVDRLIFDNKLRFQQLIDKTLENYPQTAVLKAVDEQAAALSRRGDQWLAGPVTLSASYTDDRPIKERGFYEVETGVNFPVWKWGQRDAGQSVAEQARIQVTARQRVIRFQVAGLVRRSLWDLVLREHRRKLAKQVLDVSGRLVKTVTRRVELGDLARADLLLAQSDHLEKRSHLIEAEAELMHARKRYQTITQLNRAPAFFEEKLSAKREISEEHPALVFSQIKVQRQRAELGWLKSSGAGQPSIGFGSRLEKGGRGQQRVDSLGVSVSVPFGGGAHAAPEISAANLILSEAIAERNTLFRKLEQDLHEAKHALEVDRAALTIADQRKALAEEYLRISQLQFNTGETSLFDLLKISAAAQATLRAAGERSLLLKRDIAFYNQTVGVLP